MADDAGALLVRTGLITDQALVAARAARSSSGGTIGEQLVLAGVIVDEALTEFYRSRLLVPQVNPNTLARLTPPVVAAIPEDMAVEFRCVPVSLDREGNLTVAMSDPSDRHAVDEIGFFTGKYVVRAVATQMQIAWCLGHYYGHITELGQRLLKPSTVVTAPAPAPPAAPVAPMPRVRGFTARVEASRHKVMPPTAATAPSSAPRPSDQLLTPTAEDLARMQAAQISASRPTLVPVAPPAPAPPPPAPPPPAGPSEPYAQVHVSLLERDEGTPPKPAVVRRNVNNRIVEPDPPELFARTGEVEVQTRTYHDDALPAVVISLDAEGSRPVVMPVAVVDERDPSQDVELQAFDDDEEEVTDVVAPESVVAARAGDDDAAVIHDVRDPESQPILLVQKRPGRETKPDDDDDEPSDVIMLERRKSDPPPLGEAASPGSIADAVGGAVRAAAGKRRTDKRTVIGVGVPMAMPRPPSVAETATAASAIAATQLASAAEATLPPEPVKPVTPPPVAATSPIVTLPSPVAAAILASTRAAAAAAASTGSAVAAALRAQNLRTPADGVPAVIEDGESDAMTRPHYAPIAADEVDEGWGPPGTTIPPPFLGALPGTETGPSGGAIPIAADPDDSAPLLVARLSPPPEAELARPTQTRRAVTDPGEVVRELERASTRLVELLRALDRAGTRDEVIEVLLGYLAESHDRVAFLILKGGSLTPFQQRPASPNTAPVLSLDQPSTLQDVVGTRLPYRGTVADDATLRFATEAFGVVPTEVLILPIAVRDRVVAVLYGDGRRSHSFDEHFAVAGRAAGLALERILQTRRTSG